MQMNFDDVFDGAIEGKVELESRKAEVTQLGDKPALTVSYIVVDSEPQGDNGLSANGEFVNHVVWLPSDSEPADKQHNKKKMIKGFLNKHGIDTSQPVSMEEVAEYLSTSRVHVGANCALDEWKRDNKDIIDTKVKSFFQIRE